MRSYHQFVLYALNSVLNVVLAATWIIMYFVRKSHFLKVRAWIPPTLIGIKIIADTGSFVAESLAYGLPPGDSTVNAYCWTFLYTNTAVVGGWWAVFLAMVYRYVIINQLNQLKENMAGIKKIRIRRKAGKSNSRPKTPRLTKSPSMGSIRKSVKNLILPASSTVTPHSSDEAPLSPRGKPTGETSPSTPVGTPIKPGDFATDSPASSPVKEALLPAEDKENSSTEIEVEVEEDSEENKKGFERLFWVLSKLAHWAIQVAFIIAVLIIIYATFTISIILGSRGQCTGDYTFYLSIVVMGVIALMIFGYVLLMILEVILARQKIFCQKCGFFLYMWKDDRYKFRVEFLGTVIISIITLPLYALVFFSPAGLFDVQVAFEIVSSIHAFIGIGLICPGLSIVVSVAEDIRDSIRKKNYVQAEVEKRQSNDTGPNIKIYSASKEMLIAILLNDKTFELFKTFLKREWSIENLLLWQAIQTIHAIDNKTKRVAELKKIYEKYLGPSAPLEVNVTKTVKDTILLGIQEYGTPKPSKTFDEYLKPLEQGLVANMLDSYSRFYWDNEFQAYLKTL